MKFTIRNKLIIITATLLIVPSLIIGLSSYITAKSHLNEVGTTGIKNNVMSALNMIAVLNDDVQNGTLTLKEAQSKAAEKLVGPMLADGTRALENRVDMGEYGYYFVLDEDGNAIVHPTLEGQNLYDSQAPDGMYTTKETIEAAKNGGGFVTFDFELPNSEKISPKIVYAEMDPAWGWIVVSGTYLTDFNSGANDLLITLSIVLGITLIVGTIVIIWFSNHLSRPIKLVTEKVGKVADGNLLSEQLNIRNKDEIGELASYTNRMTDNLKQMIGQVSTASMQVAATSEELSASSEQTSRSVEQVTSSIQDIAEGADAQMAKTKDSSDAMNRIAKELEQISTAMKRTDAASTETSRTAQSGYKVITQTINHMQTIQQETTSTAFAINELGNKSKEITNILSMITNVAEQTNLLALNAAIEAARAGEHGRGFAVVANEVKLLAEQSADSARQISSLIKTIQEDIDHSVIAMNQSAVTVNEGINMVNDAGDAFQQIAEGVNNVLSQIGDVSRALQDNVQQFDNVAMIVDETYEISTASAAHTQNIAAAAEEQTASMQEISAASDTLAKMAEDLQETIRSFKF